MSLFADIAESRIQEAIDNGEFQSLQGTGKPINLDAYFASPASMRAGLALLKSTNTIPTEIEAIKEIQKLQHTLTTTTDPNLISTCQRELQIRQTELNIAMERIKRTLRHDSTNG